MEANYRKEKTDEVVEKYQDLIDKVFEVTDKDLLDAEIKKATNEESEKKLLDKISHRKKALEIVEDLLDRIERLENKFSDTGDKTEPGESLHPTKRFAKK